MPTRRANDRLADPVARLLAGIACLCACFAACLGDGNVARADDYILTIGGGYSPTGNQVSLEKNVLYFQRVLSETGLGDVPHHILFADGIDPQRDLQFRDPQYKPPDVNQLLAEVFNSTNGLRDQYRSSHISGIQGAAQVQSVDQWFDDAGSKLGKGDRLMIYFTGHGGKSRQKDKQNTVLNLWNGQTLAVNEFVQRLDKLDPELEVVIVMVQCFSGGFANVIFNEGDSQKELSLHARCGFFATVHDRPAAGCTPDINEANYEEYSTRFWAALFGKTRLDQPIEPPDYDGNGYVDFSEAHAYTLLTSDTIDISITTRDALLRRYSTIAQPKDKPAIEGLLTAETPYARLIELATSSERAVLDGLSTQLALADEQRLGAARKLAGEIAGERKKIEEHKKRHDKEFHGLRNELASAAKARWPELNNPWHGETQRILRDEADEVRRVIEGHPKYDSYRKLRDELGQLARQDSTLERKWVKTQRLIRVAEDVLLAANLAKVASQEIQHRHTALLSAESGSLHKPKVAAP